MAYKFNGKTITVLNRLVLEVVKKYVDEHQNITYNALKQIFRDEIGGSRGIIKNKKDFDIWKRNIADPERRFFIKDDEIIKLLNDEIYVNQGWGDDWIDSKTGQKKDGNKKRFLEFSKQELDYQIEEETSEKENPPVKQQNKKNINIKNIILYGAPGVGKTHNYKNLISMIEEGKGQNEIFETISKNLHVSLENETFETIKKEKRVEFVTFHQSYSYEDFIEGFRPNESGNIELEDGIFKNISDNAKLNLEDSQKNKKEVEIKYSFSKLLDEFKIFVEDKISTDGTFFLKGKATISNIGKSSFFVGGSVSSEQKLTFNILERDYVNFKNGIIKSYKDIKSTFESEKGVHGNAPYYFALYKRLKEFEDTIYEDSSQEKLEVIEQKNFYIVIDEINRGNISKIFGELITLIEEDKRDKYEVTLPYSKELFKVPSNLYIIATMNSTDKSIATIDIALRRRFTFLKMKPNEKLVLHVEAKELFNALNSFIKEKLSEDYMLGHSYFMNVQNSEDLEFVKEYKIKSLLEEYFYADDESYKEAEEILNKIF
jgi:5-methylcytosine-specific restriction protein B